MSVASEESRRRELATRVAACLHEADRLKLPLVAAHLDSALVALLGQGVWPRGDEWTVERNFVSPGG